MSAEAFWKSARSKELIQNWVRRGWKQLQQNYRSTAQWPTVDATMLSGTLFRARQTFA